MRIAQLKAFLSVIPVAVFIFTAAPTVSAKTGEASVFTKAEDEALERKIKSYLNDNPEIIIEAVQKYRKQQRDARREKANENVGKYLDELTNLSKNPGVGADDPAVTVVEFMDYNCGYCKRALDSVQKVLDNRDDVHFVFQDVAVLGPSSDEAARWAMAANKQGSYFDYHAALMQHKGKKTKGILRNIAEKVGLDVDKLEKDAGAEDIQQALKRNQEVMKDIGLRGTPGFVINGEVHRGFIKYDKFKQLISDAAQQDQDN